MHWPKELPPLHAACLMAAFAFSGIEPHIRKDGVFCDANVYPEPEPVTDLTFIVQAATFMDAAVEALTGQRQTLGLELLKNLADRGGVEGAEALYDRGRDGIHETLPYVVRVVPEYLAAIIGDAPVFEQPE